MAEPSLTQRTPVLKLRYESDDTRNLNWNALDDMVARAFQPDSPLQLPPGTLSPIHPIIVPGVVTLENVASGLLFDASALVLRAGLTYRLTLAGDLTRPAAGLCTLTVVVGGVTLYDHQVRGPFGAAQTETFALTCIAYVQPDLSLRIVSTGLWGPQSDPDQLVQGPSTLFVGTVVPTGAGITVPVTWDTVRTANIAHGTLAMLETITSIP